MSCFRVMIMSGLVIVGCKTTSRDVPEAAVPPPAEPAAAEAEATIPPSPKLETTPNLVTPGPDEIMIRRGPGARCPTTLELDDVEQAVQALGQDTINLVGEDLAYIRRTSSRTDRDGIMSCCNQMEQLVQDVDIMNEDKAAAVPYVERIRRLTQQLCPPAQ